MLTTSCVTSRREGLARLYHRTETSMSVLSGQQICKRHTTGNNCKNRNIQAALKTPNIGDLPRRRYLHTPAVPENFPTLREPFTNSSAYNNEW